jgi:hypothetical protein
MQQIYRTYSRDYIEKCVFKKYYVLNKQLMENES